MQSICPQCQAATQPGSLYCSNCATPLPRPPKPSKAPAIIAVVIACTLVACGFCGYVFKQAGRTVAVVEEARPQATVDPAEVVRVEFAAKFQSDLHESGMPDVTVQSGGDVLYLQNTGLAPATVARQILSDAKTRKNLRRLGFTSLSIVQRAGFGAEGFRYDIKE